MYKTSIDYPIDIIIPWVDGNDPAWQQQKAEYSPQNAAAAKEVDDRPVRYRDWDNLQYVFRGIEKFLPWVRKVHFVTWGHLPPWLNTACPKLNVVNHKDYIPAEYLPTFSSHPIELNFHRIEGLAEHFIYANDDTFFLCPMEKEVFFADGLPVDCATQSLLRFCRPDGIDHIVVNDLIYLNKNFPKRAVMRKNIGKWFSCKYKMGLLKNLYLLPVSNFTGFADYHIPYAYLKSTFAAVWQAEPEIMDNTCRGRFRSGQDVNQWLMRYWQLAQGNFVPCGPDRGRLLVISKEDETIADVVLNRRWPMVCLSDDDADLDFEKEKDFIIDLFEQILPEKSAFEI